MGDLEIHQVILQDLRSPHADLQTMIDVIPTLAWSSRPDGFVDFLNQRWREYTGLSLDESHGWGWKTAIHPEDLPGLLQR